MFGNCRSKHPAVHPLLAPELAIEARRSHSGYNVQKLHFVSVENSDGALGEADTS